MSRTFKSIFHAVKILTVALKKLLQVCATFRLSNTHRYLQYKDTTRKLFFHFLIKYPVIYALVNVGPALKNLAQFNTA